MTLVAKLDAAKYSTKKASWTKLVVIIRNC